MFLGLQDPDPDPLGRLWIRIRILLLSCKNSKQNLDSYYLVTLFDFLSLKNDVNVPSKSNKQKKLYWKLSFLLAFWRSMTKISGSGSESGSISQRHESADPDPPQNVMDPQHWLWDKGIAIYVPYLIMTGGRFPSSSICPSRPEICIVFTMLPYNSSSTNYYLKRQRALWTGTGKTGSSKKNYANYIAKFQRKPQLGKCKKEPERTHIKKITCQKST